MIRFAFVSCIAAALVACGGKSTPTNEPAPPPAAASWQPQSCDADEPWERDDPQCPDGMVLGCTRGGGSGATRRIACAPAAMPDEPGTPCSQEIALACPEGHVDACLVDAADTHFCITAPTWGAHKE
jgi:hypothetical protein